MQAKAFWQASEYNPIPAQASRDPFIFDFLLFDYLRSQPRRPVTPLSCDLCPPQTARAVFGSAGADGSSELSSPDGPNKPPSHGLGAGRDATATQQGKGKARAGARAGAAARGGGGGGGEAGGVPALAEAGASRSVRFAQWPDGAEAAAGGGAGSGGGEEGDAAASEEHAVVAVPLALAAAGGGWAEGPGWWPQLRTCGLRALLQVSVAFVGIESVSINLLL